MTKSNNGPIQKTQKEEDFCRKESRPKTLPFARINFNSYPILSKRSSEIMEQGSEVARPDTVSCAAFCDGNFKETSFHSFLICLKYFQIPIADDGSELASGSVTDEGTKKYYRHAARR